MDDAFLFGGVNPLAAILERSARRGPTTHVELYVAYVSRSGLVEIRSLLRNHALKGSAVRVLCSADPFASDLGALYDIGSAEDWEILWHPDPAGGRYHPKAYIAHTSETATIFVGSPNATRSAFTTNVEVGRIVTLPLAGDEFRGLSAYLQRLWKRGLEITPERAHLARVARQFGLGAIAVGALSKDLRSSAAIARHLMRHALARSGATPCLDSLGEDARALDLALAFDYLRSVASIDVPLSTCLEIVRRANLPGAQFLKVSADIHRPFQELKKAKGFSLRPVVEAPEEWPRAPASAAIPSGSMINRLRWLLQDAERSPLFHSIPPSAAPEWAYTLDFLHSVCGIDIPWTVARDIVRRSRARGVNRIVQPDTIRHEFRLLPEFGDFKREKGWVK